MQKVDNLIDVVGVLYSKRRLIVSITVTTAILAALLSLTLDNYYKARTTFYAASPDLAKPERIFGYSSYDMNYYGSGLDIDRLMTIAFSNELAEFLIDSFDLYTHYDIDSSKAKAKFRIKETLSGHYDVIKTKFDAIELSIEDKERDLAASMANAARNKINGLAQQVIKGSQETIISAYENSIKDKENELKLLSDSLQSVRLKYGIFNPEAQAEVLAEVLGATESKLVRERERLKILLEMRGIPRDTIRLLQAKVQGLEKEYNSMVDEDSESKFTLSKFNKGKGQVEALEQQYSQTHKQISYDKIRLEQLKTAYNANITTIHLVEKAEVPVIKSRPRRSLIVVGAGLVAFILSCLGFLLLETIKTNQWKNALKS